MVGIKPGLSGAAAEAKTRAAALRVASESAGIAPQEPPVSSRFETKSRIFFHLPVPKLPITARPDESPG
jgi:hypothetical protein